MSAKHYQHPQALVEAETIGNGTRVWAFAHVMRGAVVGADCNIGEQCFIESGARLGDGVTVKNGVSVWDGVTVENDVFLGPNAVLTNDPRPRSRSADFVATPTLLAQGCSIGANATLLCGIRVGRFALVGAGAVVTRDVADHTLVVGNPARASGFVCRCARKLSFAERHAGCACGLRFTERDGLVVVDDATP